MTYVELTCVADSACFGPAPPAPAPTPAPAPAPAVITVATHIVKMAVKLPYTVAEFDDSKQAKFKQVSSAPPSAPALAPSLRCLHYRPCTLHPVPTLPLSPPLSSSLVIPFVDSPTPAPLQSIANAAGISASDVTIDKVSAISTSRRRLLAESIRVDTRSLNELVCIWCAGRVRNKTGVAVRREPSHRLHI